MLSALNTLVKGFFASLGAVGIIAYFVLLICLFIGYFVNIFKLITMAFTGIGDQVIFFILRLAGIFVGPLGGIIGWF